MEQKKNSSKRIIAIILFVSRKIMIYWEKLIGVDFTASASLEKRGFNPNKVFSYKSSGDRHLLNLLKKLQIEKGDRIIDIGCGKGAALNIMRRFSFALIDGIEISEELSIIARKNFTVFNDKRITIYNCDAINFPNYDKYNIYYLFNPFDDTTLIKIMDMLAKIHANKKTKALIIYVNPVFHETIVSNTGFSLVSVFAFRLNKAHIYSNIPC